MACTAEGQSNPSGGLAGPVNIGLCVAGATRADRCDAALFLLPASAAPTSVGDHGGARSNLPHAVLYILREIRAP